MSWEVFLALLAFSFVASATPGPNTLMLLASGVNFGLARTVPHIVGIAFGFGSLLLATGFGVGQLLEASPRLHLVMKVVSAGYLVWLAWKIGTARAIGSRESAGEPLTALQAAMFQWVNPKAWAMALTAITVYSPSNELVAILTTAIIFGAINLPSCSIWMFVGQQLRHVLQQPKHLRRFNICMALLLLLSLYPILFPAV